MRSTIFATLILIGLSGLAASPVTNTSESEPSPFAKGLTVSCPGVGEIWGSDARVECMAELKAMGEKLLANMVIEDFAVEVI